MANRNIILFPTDFSERARAALPWAKRMVSELDADLHCVFVLQAPQVFEGLNLGPTLIPPIEDMVRSANDRMTSYAKDELKDFPNAVCKVLEGRPATEIVSYAKKNNVSAIVMTTHGYSGITHALLGSTTEAVLRHAPCPVLSIRAQ
jgi:nucleotide-binding universal stress UspA family protein